MRDNGLNGFGILIVAHGQLAQEFLLTLEHVIGKQCRIEAISVEDRVGKDELRELMEERIEALDNGKGVVVVTDMFGGTPSNLAIRASKERNTRILFGINMPALIKLARLREVPIDEAVSEAVRAGHRYLNSCDRTGM